MGKTIIGYVGVMGYQDGVDLPLRALHHLVYGLAVLILLHPIAAEMLAGLKMKAHELISTNTYSLRVCFR